MKAPLFGERASFAAASARGFTIIEILVVVAVIGLLAMAILTTLSGARDKARYQTAFSTAKGMQAAANFCLTENVAVCLPGSNSAPCTATALLDTTDGGGGAVCSSRPTMKYAALPFGWVWCDANGATGACNSGSTASAQNTGVSFNIRLKRTADNVVITCTETGCTCSGAAGLCPNY